MHKEKASLKAFGWENKRLIFVRFCNHKDSKTGVLKVGRHCWDRTLRVLPYC